MRLVSFAAASLVVLAGCGGSSSGSVAPAAAPVVLGWSPEYLGFATSSCTSFATCLRAPGVNDDVPVSQGGASDFTVRTSDATVATANIHMMGPGGQGDPSVAVVPVKAGTATITVAGAHGESAQLPVVVTTISTMTIALHNLPTASGMTIAVSAPPAANCPSFEGGYTFQWAASPTTIIHNFPAMGTGPLAGCIFSTVSFTVTDSSNVTLAQKTVALATALGKDNPASVTIP